MTKIVKWVKVEVPAPEDLCEAKRGPKSYVRCTMRKGHNPFYGHNAMGRFGQFFSWPVTWEERQMKLPFEEEKL